MGDIILVKEQKFSSRSEIGKLFGGNHQYGITVSSKANAILLFKNERELYSDYFYPKGSDDYCLYTGIGRSGHQDNPNNKNYYLNMAVLMHKINNRSLLVFEKRKSNHCFVGEYELTEMHQNIQPDDSGRSRRVFVFRLKKISDTINILIT